MAPKSKVNPELDEVLSRPENLFCVDCGAKAPRWASVNLGILMCIDCSGAHRNLGTHISVVKSTTLDKWQPKWIDVVTKIGNKTGNAYYEYDLPKSQKLKEGEDGQKVATWIRNKYDKKQWAARGRASPSELLAKGLDPDYDSGDDKPRRRDGPSRGDDRSDNRARPRQTEDAKPKRAARDSAPIPSLQSKPNAAAKPSVDLLGDDGPSTGPALAQPTFAQQSPSPATSSPWTAEFQQAAQPPSPFGAQGGFNPGCPMPQQTAPVDFQQQQQQMLLAQQQQQQLQRGGPPRPSNAAGPASTSWSNKSSPSSAAAAAKAAQLPPTSTPFGTGSLTVACKNPKPEDAAVVRTLTGDYAEHGNNHGRKVYRKPAGKGPDAVDVFLYYWNDSDGASFQGWWFGNEVGGSQVWSHCSADAQTPPKAGWKVPWDGSVCEEMTIVPTLRSAVARPKPPESAGAQMDSSGSSVVTSIVDALSACIQHVKQTQEQAKTLAGGYDNQEALKEAEEALTPAVTEITEALKKYAEGRQRATGDQMKRLNAAQAQLRTLLQSVNMDLGKVRSAKKGLEQSLKDQELEQKDLLTFEEFIPEARHRAEAAEDAVEKAVITSELIAAAGDDLDEVKQAVQQTEEAVQEAQKIIGEARIVLNAKLGLSRKFESQSVKQKATDEIAALQKQLQDCQAKLNPLKTARQDYVQREKAQKLVLEVLEKLGPAEVDVDRAEEASALVGTDSSSASAKEALQDAEKAVNAATDHILAAIRFIEAKKKAVVGAGRDELQKLEERAKESQKRLNDMKAAHKERVDKAHREQMLVEAAEKLQLVSESLAKAGEAESPFLLGVEELPADQMITAVKACEAALTAANTATSAARMFLATKMVEAKRLSKEAGEGTLERLKELQEQLEEYTKKYNEIKKATTERKKEALMRESEDEVKKAEDLSTRAKELVGVLEDHEKLFAMSPAEVKKAASEALTAEAAATSALAKTKKFVTDRQIQAKSKDPSSNLSSELIKYQLRISTAIADMVRCKKACTGIDKRLEARKVVEEAKSRVSQAQGRLKTIEEKLEALKENTAQEIAKPSEETEKMVKEIEVGLAEAQASLKNAKSFYDTHSRASAMEKDDLVKLVQPTLQEAQEKFESMSSAIKEQIEKTKVAAIIQEAESKVVEVEKLKEEVEQAELRLLQGAELSAEEAGKALSHLETKVTEANQSATTTKTALAMKKLATKRLAGQSKDSTNQLLQELQDRIEAVSKVVLKAKRSIADQKAGTVRREVIALVEAVEKKVADADELMSKLEEELQSTSSESMKVACEKCGIKQIEAQSKLDEARQTLQERQRHAKGDMAADMNTTLLAEVSVALDKLKKLSEKLEKMKGSVREAEHRFVAQKLLQEATEKVDKLELELTSVGQEASTFEKKIEILLCLDQLAEALRLCIANEKLEAAGLLQKMSGNGSSKVAEEHFVAFCTNLLKTEEMKDYIVNEEQLKGCFNHMLKEGCTELEEAQFVDFTAARYLVTRQVSMTSQLSVVGGKSIRKVDTGEVVLGLAASEKEDAAGLVRVFARDKDGREGYISISGNQGTQYLKPCSACDAYVAEADVTIQNLATSVKEVLTFVETKAADLKTVRVGPLTEARDQIMKLRPRVMKVSHAQTDLKKKGAAAQKKISKVLEAEKEKRQEAADQRAASAISDEVDEMMKKLESSIAESTASAEAAVENGDAKKLQDATTQVQACQAEVKEALSVLASKLEVAKQSSKGPMSELKSALLKKKTTAEASDAGCRKKVQSLKTAADELANKARRTVVDTLRAKTRKEGLTTEALFASLCESGHEISRAKLREYLSTKCDDKLTDEVLELGLEKFGETVSKLDVAFNLEDYQKCVKDIAITTTLSVKEVKTSRKLGLGEIVEVVEPAAVDEASKLLRVKCRALQDNTLGYVTLQGNQGTPYLEVTRKPYLVCDEEVPLQGAFEVGSEELRKSLRGEVFELLEGPRQEPAKEVTRVKGKCKKDGKVGYLTLKDAADISYLEQTKRLVCKQAVALTTVFDIAEGKAVRKLESGEVLEQLDAEDKKDEARGLWRTRVRASDKLEGWATIKGNQGTEYLQPTDKYYVCTRAIPLEPKVTGSEAALREIEVGELIEALGKPTVQTLEGCTRARGRSCNDGLEAWFTTSGGVKPWQPVYEAIAAMALCKAVEVGSDKSVRKVEPGERFQALTAPFTDKSSGLLRVRVRAEQDGSVGFVTIRGNQGTWFVQSVPIGKEDKTSRR
mmetsp:Transcript_24359/g.56133  ORF Transcript_24359/g.56133 Transcript_24359/m.56133 type:complete len:2250 (+) Transcript_24359:128-6877(+)